MSEDKAQYDAGAVDGMEAKPCPFCGGTLWTMDKTLRDGYENATDDPDAYAYNVRCNHCAAQGGWGKSIGVARNLWSMRTRELLLLSRITELEAAALNLCGTLRHWHQNGDFECDSAEHQALEIVLRGTETA